MLDDLKALEDDRPRGAPELIVVSTGSAEENRAQGLRSMVVLDDEFTAGATFGATGTPAAVLLDAHGMIASPVAVGKVSVMRLSAR